MRSAGYGPATGQRAPSSAVKLSSRLRVCAVTDKVTTPLLRGSPTWISHLKRGNAYANLALGVTIRPPPPRARYPYPELVHLPQINTNPKAR